MHGSAFFSLAAVTRSVFTLRAVVPRLLDMLGRGGESHADEREQKFDRERSTIARPSRYHAGEVCMREPT